MILMHSVAPPKSKAILLLRERIGEIFLKLLYYKLLGMMVKICNFKKISVGQEESKNLIFDYCFVNFFPTYKIFYKLV